MAKKYKWQITAIKFAWSFAEIVATGCIVYATDRPELFLLVPIAEAVKNYLKHRN